MVAAMWLPAQSMVGSTLATAAPAVQPVAVQAHVVTVLLPLAGEADIQLMASVDRLLETPAAGKARRIVIFEFRPDTKAASGTTRFERALALARYLASERFRDVQTIAFLPKSVRGQAVLPVLACEQIIMAPDAELGAAGEGETSIDAMMRSAYREISLQRRTIPVAIALGMLDPTLEVTEVQLVGGGTGYVLPDELKTLRADSKTSKEKTVIPAGEFGLFTGRQLRVQFGFCSHLASDRKQLADVLQLAPKSIIDVAASPQGRKALRLNLHGRLTSRLVSETLRSLQDAVSHKKVNLIFLDIDSPGGEAEPALRLIHAFSELDPGKVRTVAFIGRQALSVAAPVALMCDDTFIAQDARLGGPGDTFLQRGELDDFRDSLRKAADSKGCDWSPLVGLLDPKLQVFRFHREGGNESRNFCERERQEQRDPGQWVRDRRLQLADGISGAQAKQLGLVRGTAPDLKSVFATFHIDDAVAVAKRNSLVTSIERLAMQPWFARTLLFVAFFALITEASAPGIGVAGFVSGFCFMLFFWAQFLNGTAGWLEIVLFGGGLICLALEIFVIPGFGVFGIGGGIMVLSSIVLASQTFVIPRNAYQFDQLPSSMFSMVTAAGGVLVALWIMRRILPDAPLFCRMMLPTPDSEQLDEVEQLVDWTHLEGKRGVATTQLTPSGKALFGDELVNVISDGMLVPRGTPVYVIQVRGNHVLVGPVDES